MNLGEGRGALADRLKFVSQQHKAGAGVVFFQYHQLGGRIVLHLIDHDVLCAQVFLAGEQHFQIEPLQIGELFRTQQPASDAVDVQPLAGVDRLESTSVLALDTIFFCAGTLPFSRTGRTLAVGIILSVSGK